MTGKEVIDFIHENKLEDCRIMMIDRDYSRGDRCLSVMELEVGMVREDSLHDHCYIRTDYFEESIDGERVIIIV